VIYIGLLRGINVGGRRSLKMAALREVVEASGGECVATYIQSGNVVFSHPDRSAVRLEADLERRLERASGMIVPVVLRTMTQWEAIIAGNPFPHAGPKHLHVLFLKQRVSARAFAGLDLKALLPEELAVRDQHLYLHLPNGMGRARLPLVLERQGPKDAVGTARNWATVRALQELAQRLSV
jgi:uncharacterized protein (DUF1697 family)